MLYVAICFILIEQNCNHPENPASEEFEEEELDLPLSHAFFHNDKDGLQSLQRFIEHAVNPFGQELDVVITRNKDLLQQMIRKYKHPSFDITQPLNVSFHDESGIDAGGITREYFSLLMQRLAKPTGTLDLFEGTSGHLVPKHNYDYLSGGLFILVGKMLLHAILNKCNGVAGLSPAAVAYIINGTRDSAVEHVVLEDIPDPVVQEQLKQVF